VSVDLEMMVVTQHDGVASLASVAATTAGNGEGSVRKQHRPFV